MAFCFPAQAPEFGIQFLQRAKLADGKCDFAREHAQEGRLGLLRHGLIQRDIGAGGHDPGEALPGRLGADGSGQRGGLQPEFAPQLPIDA